MPEGSNPACPKGSIPRAFSSVSQICVRSVSSRLYIDNNDVRFGRHRNRRGKSGMGRDSGSKIFCHQTWKSNQMSRTRKYNPDTLAIMDRYFIAVEACVKAKLLKNLTAYCADTGIEKNHFYIQRKDRTRGYFEVGWVTPLIRNCGISATWILTGVGTMFA